MCLERLGAFEPCKEGYKVVRAFQNGRICCEIRGNKKELRVGRWLNERNYRSPLLVNNDDINEMCGGAVYPFGFHIYHTEETANLWNISNQRVVKVKVRYPVAVGYQIGDEMVTVAKEIKIVGEGRLSRLVRGFLPKR